MPWPMGVEKGWREEEGGIRKGKRGMERKCAQLCFLFQPELTQQKGAGGGGGCWQGVQRKAAALVSPFPFWLAQGAASLPGLVSKGGSAGGKGICLFQFSMILFNPDINLANKLITLERNINMAFGPRLEWKPRRCKPNP